MKRLLIYLTYDKQNIIDDYIGYFLCSMRRIADFIAVICNMPVIEKGLHNLSDYADSIFYRENKGLDAGGFKDALCTFIGWDEISRYDELILVNDSFYGPFDDIGMIFSKMESRNLDFWGLMKRGAGEYGITGNDPEHILSFFYVFQAPLIHSVEFRNYWESLPYYRDYMTVVKQYERKLTSHFAGLGYIYDAYADTDPNETENLKNQFFQCDYLSYEMIVKRNFPFLKRKQLSYNTLYHQTQENLSFSIDYVDRYTDYDTNLIWENLIRTQNHTELQRSLGLQYILKSGETKRHSNAVICVRAEWMNAANTAVEYLERICMACDIQVFTDNTDIKSFYQEKGFFTVLSEKADVEILLGVDTKKYQYICLLHDTDLSSDRIPSCTGKSYFFNIWENLARDAGYIHSVLELLDRKTYIGMLMHPVPIFSTWVGKLGRGWENKFEAVKEFIEKLKLRAVINENVPPIHVTGNFWVKAEVVNSFKKKFHQSSCGDTSEDLYLYLWSYLVQDSGKLTGIVESKFYVSMNETNYHYYLKTFLEWFTEQYGEHEKLEEFGEIFYAQSAAEQCRSLFGKWYVYGTGEIAERCSKWIQDTDGFIVSDGQKRVETFQGKPVICLSELEDGEEFGVVLCLSKENQDKVVPLLEKKGIKNYYTIN